MKALIQTGVCSIVYGEFRGEENQELFRCPRELDNEDLRRYINENRCMFRFENDNEVEDLKDFDNYLGYYRLYFKNGWCGRWMEGAENMEIIDCIGVDEIVDWLRYNFPTGCDWKMIEYLKAFPVWGCDKRYLLKPFMSEHYRVMIDTTYGNGDYPVRIYVYR